MIAKDVTFDLSLVLLIAAVVLFILGAIRPIAARYPWVVSAGLACFAGAFLSDRLF